MCDCNTPDFSDLSRIYKEYFSQSDKYKDHLGFMNFSTEETEQENAYNKE
jgi:hypothetical protein